MEPPQFAHLPALLNQKGKKISKKFTDASVSSYLEKGYLPEALVNGVALLGWNPPHREDPTVLAETTGVFLRHEVMQLDDMANQFNLDKITRVGVSFDLDKFQYLNSMHIRAKFAYTQGNLDEAIVAVNKWRKLLLT